MSPAAARAMRPPGQPSWAMEDGSGAYAAGVAIVVAICAEAWYQVPAATQRWARSHCFYAVDEELQAASVEDGHLCQR